MMSVTYETLTPQSNPNDDSPITVIHNDDGEEMRRLFFSFSPQNSDNSSAYLREMFWDFYEDDDVWSDAGYDDDYNDLVPVDATTRFLHALVLLLLDFFHFLFLIVDLIIFFLHKNGERIAVR